MSPKIGRVSTCTSSPSRTATSSSGGIIEHDFRVSLSSEYLRADALGLGRTLFIELLLYRAKMVF